MYVNMAHVIPHGSHTNHVPVLFTNTISSSLIESASRIFHLIHCVITKNPKARLYKLLLPLETEENQDGVGKQMMDEVRAGSLGSLSETLDLRQGLFPGWSTALEGSDIKDILVNHDVQTCTVLQHGVVSLYEDGKVMKQYRIDTGITWLLYVTRLSKYAAFTSSTVKLLDKQFQCTYESPTPTRINSAVYNDCSGDVVTTGPGNITTWMFRQGGRVISPREPITAGFVKDDVVSKLHLEQVPGKAQKSFVVVDNGVKVHWLQDGLLMANLVELHSRPITSIFYFRPMRLLITAAEDGSIKVWDGLWRLCSTFVGHRGTVTCLAPYTHLPCIVSGSMDGSIRVWNLETLDQVEKLKHKTPVMGLSAQPDSSIIISYSDRHLYSWSVHKFVVELISLGCTIKHLTHTTHPTVPMSVVAITDDSVVRLLSPVRCHIITTALLPITSSIVSVATAAHSKTLYVLLDDGRIHVMDYSTNPCTLKDTWSTRLNGLCSFVTLYESVLSKEEVEDVLKEDPWLAIKLSYEKELQERYPHRKQSHNMFEGKVLLMAGSYTGRLMVIDQELGGAVVCSVQAHENRITLIACNPKADQVISAGEDNVIKVWRVYPNVKHDILSPLMMFVTRCRPSHLLATKYRLCVATNQLNVSAYNVTLYNLATNVSYTHHPMSAHTDRITGISACEKLHLFISSSLDTTLRLWSEDNVLLRILHVGGIPSSVTFSSEKADLLMSMNETLYEIAYPTYLPDSCITRLQLAGTRCSSPLEQTALPYHTDPSSLPPSDAARLDKVKLNKERLSFRGVLSEEELIMLERAAAAKAEAVARLQQQDNELKRIRDGLVPRSKKPVKLTPHNKEKMWKQLLDILQPRKDLGIEVDDEDDFDPDGDGKTSSIGPVESKFTKSPPNKFFPPLTKFEPPYPIAPDCHLPNSAVLKELQKCPEDLEAAEKWKPPLLTARQLELIKKHKEEEVSIATTTISEDTDYMGRLRAALEDPLQTTPPPTPTPPSTPSPSPSPPPRPRTPPKIEKLIAPKPPPPKKPPTPSPSPPKTPTPPPRSPTPPPPPTPLPEYIAQFIGQQWFDQLFPGANSKTFPKPWTVGRFVDCLLFSVSRCSNFINKSDLFAAVQMLYTRHDITTRTNAIGQCISMQLDGPPHLSPSRKADRQYIKQLLSLLQTINALNGHIVTHLMAIYVTSDQQLKDMIVACLLSHGLEDPEGHLVRTLEDWTVGDEEEEVEEVQKSTSDWLLYWKEELNTSQQSKKGTTPTKKGTKSVISQGLRKGKTKPKKEKQVPIITISLSSINKEETIDVLNYFVKLEHQKYLDRLAASMRIPTPVHAEPEEEEGPPCNTVIPLPKITRHRCLARLGETHHSKCHPQRETSLALVRHLPQLQRPTCACPDSPGWQHFTHHMTLPTKPLLLDPFAGMEDEMPAQPKSPEIPIVGLSKYFIPENSYIKPMR